MAWKSITHDEYEFGAKMLTWIETVRKAYGNPAWLPTEADLVKSALLERLRNGLDPLPEPPPVGMSCPWYALIEDPQPQFAGAGHFAPSPFFGDETKISVVQNVYAIVDREDDGALILRDCREPPTSYRFRLWLDPDWRSRDGRTTGGWFIQNTAFPKPDKADMSGQVRVGPPDLATTTP